MFTCAAFMCHRLIERNSKYFDIIFTQIIPFKSYILISLFFIICFFFRQVPLPSFQKLLHHYPGYKHFGGRFSHHRIVDIIGCNKTDLLHDTSALRMSFALNKIGSVYSIGHEPIHLSKFGKDSVAGRDGYQYLFHPLAFGPYMADKFGYPSISVLHDKDPIATKRKFWGKQGIMEIITYTKFGNKPKGHIALWNCDRLYQTKDWISKHSLLTIQFWESPGNLNTNLSHERIYSLIFVNLIRQRLIVNEAVDKGFWFYFSDSKCNTVFQKDNSPSQVTGTWDGRKYDTLRLKAARKLVRFNQIYRKMPHRRIKFQY